MAALQFMPLSVLPHLLTVLILAVLFAGILALNRAITGQVRWPALLLALPLLYSWIFNWGFANFLLGLGLALLTAAWWLKQRDRPVRRVGFALLLALAIFFCHALAFGLFGILIASLELGHWWLQRPRRFAALVSALGQCALLAVVPAILFLQSRTATAAGGVSNVDESLARLRARGLVMNRLAELAVQRVETSIRVAEGPSYPADALWLLLLLALLGAGLPAACLAVGTACGGSGAGWPRAGAADAAGIVWQRLCFGSHAAVPGPGAGRRDHAGSGPAGAAAARAGDSCRGTAADAGRAMARHGGRSCRF